MRSTAARPSRAPRTAPVLPPTLKLAGTLLPVTIHKQALIAFPTLEQQPQVEAETLDELQTAIGADPAFVQHAGKIVRTIAVDAASPTGKRFRAFLVSK